MKKTLALLLALLMMIGMEAAAGGEQSGATIEIGIVYPEASIDGDTYYREGLDMAIDEINRAGGIAGKQLVPVIEDDGGDITTGLIIAQSLVDRKVAAVIGHWSSNVCYVVKDLYESCRMPMISPAATSESLMEDGGSYTFRTIPGCETYAGVLAADMAKRGLKSIAIYYTDDVYGFAYANELEMALATRGIEVVDRVSSISPSSAQRVADRWTAFGVDGVFVAATMPDAANVIQLIRAMHPTFPVYGAENFDRKSFRDELSGDTSRTYAAAFDLDKIDQAFLKAYRDQYGHDPHVFAITGYMAVMMLKDAFLATGGTDPAAVSAYLKTLKAYPSIGGALSYDEASGDFSGHALCVRALDMN